VGKRAALPPPLTGRASGRLIPDPSEKEDFGDIDNNKRRGVTSFVKTEFSRSRSFVMLDEAAKHGENHHR